VIAALRRQLVVPVGQDVAFGAFTEEIGQWWPVGDGHSVFGAGAAVAWRDGRLVETAPDGREAAWGTVLHWDPPHRLRLTWHPGRAEADATEVEVTFFPLDGGPTLVTLEHRGWERYADPTAARDEYSRGWPTVLNQFAARTGAGATVGDDEVWFVLSHTVGPALSEGQSPFAHPDFPAHLAFLKQLGAEGVLVAAGALDGNGDGMTVVRLPDPSGAAELVRRAQDEDQSVARGLFQVRARPWRVALTG